MRGIDRWTSALAAVVICSAFAPNARAVTWEEAGHAASACTPAFGPSEVSIRKRPLGLQNEGTSTAFVTCSFTAPTAPTRVILHLSSSDGAFHEMTCTGVSGAVGDAVLYSPRWLSVASGGTTEIAWIASHFDPSGASDTFPFQQFSVSCGLPPGAAINDFIVTSTIE